jgi:hypothetical protein
LGTTTGTTSAVWLRHSDIIDHGETAASGLLSTEPIEVKVVYELIAFKKKRKYIGSHTRRRFY